MSEVSKHRQQLLKYCYDRNGQPAPGVDLASGGDPLAPWGWTLELPQAEYDHYNSHQNPRGPVQLRGHCQHRCTEPESLSWVCASHILEDFPPGQWPDLFRTWSSMLQPGGHLIILVPEHERWAKAIAAGQPPNCSHHVPEPSLGDMSRVAKSVGLDVLEERFANDTDYTIIGVFRKP